MQKIPIHRTDDNELLGYITKDTTGWDAQTIFGYSIARSADRKTAETTVKEQGLSFLTGVWQYFDKDDGAWHPCVLKEAYEQRVIVMRTNVMGYQDPTSYKVVSIDSPDETKLIKAT